MIKKFLIIMVFLGITLSSLPSITGYGFMGDKSPVYQSQTDKECIERTGVNMSWVETFTTDNYIHYVNREVEHALVYHDAEMLIFAIKGLEEVYIICGQVYLDGTQNWQLFEVDIYNSEDAFTKRYREMLCELATLIPEPEKKCIIKND
ncbi:MAG: hypothetical protein QGF57_03990 [Candidatus Marinimicrobia bacterium]|jgi:hypothetical protein|nr:hypothetical protein [Candidatus Neomarinimicrobiota bacterium]